MPAQRLTYDDAIAFSDAELVERLWSRMSDIEDEDIYGDLSLFLDELCERHVPAISRLVVEFLLPDEYLEENLEAMREREGARLIHGALGARGSGLHGEK
jgi:hypothetical protein